jgi:hypothetical protein
MRPSSFLPPLLVVLWSAVGTGLGDEWDDVRASYGNLIHVAGIGADQNVNSWNPGYEGANGLAVELSNPHMAVADAAGNIYIADKESHSILRLSPQGIIHTVAGTHVGGFNGDGPALSTQLTDPNGVFALADGTFYIVDLGNQRIRRVGTDGQCTTVVTEPTGLRGRALWVSPDEKTIYYAGIDGGSSPSLKRWSQQDGIVVISSGFVSLGNITVDRDGRPIVTEDIGNRVYRIGSNGDKTLIAGNGSTFGGGDGFAAVDTGLNRVRGVACLPNGGMFVATQKGSHVWYIDTAGIIHKAMDCSATGSVNAGNDQPWTTPGVKMSEPRAISLAPNGDLLITASDFGQIRVVKCLQNPAPPAGFKLEALSAPGQRRLRWAGVPWQSYIIEHTPTLQPPAWEPTGFHTAEPAAASIFTLPANLAPQGYYRIRMPR